MRKIVMIGLALALVAVACGGTSDAGDNDPPVDATGPDDGAPSIETPPVSESEPAGSGEIEPTTTTGPADLVPLPPVTTEKIKDVGVTTTTTATPTPPPVVEHPNPQVATALSDLVARVSVDPAEVTLVSIEEVTWSDGSLGCPLPGMRYTQALVNGTRIVLEIGGTTFEYHSGAGRDPFYCADPSDPVGGDDADQ